MKTHVKMPAEQNKQLENTQHFAGVARTVFEDLRPQNAALLEQQNTIRNSPRQHSLQAAQAMAAGRKAKSPALAVQRKSANLTDSSNYRDQVTPTQVSETVSKNKTSPKSKGLPAQLKMSIEMLSGLNLDQVQVETNSNKPAQLNAHAYAQGSEIHLAPGQEQHLPHEAWHVVQQAQGRVTPTMQMKSGISVNDDAVLEAEADTMGARALAVTNDTMARQTMGFKNLDSVRQLKTTPNWGRTNTIQRRKDIPKGAHVQVNQGRGTWHGQVVEVYANEGNFRYQIRMGGGSKTNTHTVEEKYVEIHTMFGGPKNWAGEGDQRLDRLLMNAGQLGEYADAPEEHQAPVKWQKEGGDDNPNLSILTADIGTIKIDEGGWEDIALALKHEFLPKQKEAENPASFVEYICSIKITKDNCVVEPLSNTNQVAGVAAFILAFMAKNGQLSYIKNQPWFNSGEYFIDVLVNYYPDRSGFQDALRFHKDTAGNNIFVNLIFDNQTDIVATEWIEDVDDPSQQRQRWQAGLLPKEQIAELARSRKALRYIGNPKSEVKGGVSKGKNTYVSWVDDLVWHSTPNAGKRELVTAESLKNEFHNMFVKNKERGIKDVEFMSIIATCKYTKLYKALLRDGKKSQDINHSNAYDYFSKLYETNQLLFEADVDLRAAEGEIRITNTYSEANAPDVDTLGEDSESIHETPVGLAGRRRANSMDGNQAELEAAREVSKNDTRSFLRTWVQIVKTK